MVRAEDQTVFGNASQAKTSECRVCGKPLKFKDQKQEDSDANIITSKTLWYNLHDRSGWRCNN